MLARIRKARENEGGFTLIELLVVMIIIGILAAIAIPVFLSQRAKAQDTAAKADLSTIGKEIATYYVDGVGKDSDGAPKVAISTTAGPTLGHYVLTVNAVTGPPAQGIVSQDLGKASTNNVVPAGAQFYAGSDSWCVSIQNPKGDKAVAGYKYSAANGLSEGQCTTAAG